MSIMDEPDVLPAALEPTLAAYQRRGFRCIKRAAEDQTDSPSTEMAGQSAR